MSISVDLKSIFDAMAIALIATTAIVVIFIAVEVALRLLARRERERFDNLPHDEQRKYQDSLHKAQSYSNS